MTDDDTMDPFAPDREAGDMPYDEPHSPPAGSLDRLDERVDNLRRVVKDFIHQSREQMQVQESSVRLILNNVDELKRDLEDVSIEAKAANATASALKKEHDDLIIKRAERDRLVKGITFYAMLAFGGVGTLYGVLTSGGLHAFLRWFTGALGPSP